MKRTISIKLAASPAQEERLTLLQQEFAHAVTPWPLSPWSISAITA